MTIPGFQSLWNILTIEFLNPFRTKGHICPMFLKRSQIWLRQSRVLNCIHTDSLCYWLYVNKPGCDIYSLASLPNWQELSLEMPSINRKFDFLYKNNDVTKQKIDIGLAFICAYHKVLMLLIPHSFFIFCKIFVFMPWDTHVPTVHNRMRLYIGLHNTQIDSY